MLANTSRLPQPKLTERQEAALPHELNLADGHAYRGWNVAEETVITTAAARFCRIDRRSQCHMESEYFRNFFELARQTLDQEHFARFPCFTASAGIELIANHLRLRGLSVALIEPCFDNLKDILRRHRVPLRPVPDDLLEGDWEMLEDTLERARTDALFLVSPNNPTGITIDEPTFTRIVDFCARRGMLLIVDACFRFYLPEAAIYDQYAVLADSDVDCIVVEDTGKTWPSLELKGPFISVSPRLADDIGRINADFVLHVSPFTIGLMNDFVALSIGDRCAHIHGVVARNRARLADELENTFLRPTERPFMSVSWLRIEARMTAAELTDALSAEDVHVLPGNKFYWTDESLGDPYLRLALVREPAMFDHAVRKLVDVCRRLDVPVTA